MAERAADGIELGYNSAVAAIPDTRTYNYAVSKMLKVFPVELKIKYADIFCIYRLGSVLKEFSADICIVGKTELLSIAIAARNLFSQKTAIILYQQMQSGIKKKDLVHNWIYRNLDGAIVLTQKMKNELSETTLFQAAKTSVVPYGIDLKRYKRENHNRVELRKKYELIENAFIFGSAARIEPEKGQHIALKAFAEAGIENSLLAFAGNVDDKDYYDSLLQNARELGIGDKVRFLGFVSNTAELMNLFDVFVLPSMSETFGIVLVEAMASSTPVAATDSGGVPEIIEDGKTGFLFTQKDWKKLSEIMLKYYSEPTVSAEIANNAFKRAELKYNYNIQRDKFFDFCNHIIGQRK